MEKIQLFLALIKHEPFLILEYVVTLGVPLVIIVFLFQWRVRNKMKRHEKEMKKRGQILKKLHNGRKEKEAPAVEDEVVAEAIKQLEEKAKKYK